MAISSYNTSFLTGAGEIIGEITSISFSGISAAEIDVTKLSDTTKTYVLGTTDGGTVDIACNMTGAVPTLPTSGDATPSSFLIRFGGIGTTPLPSVQAAFTAYVSNTSFEASVDSQVTTNYTLRLTGAVTMTTSATT